MNYICNEHFISYNSYCKDCKLNLCIKCDDNHFDHDIIYFNELIPKNISSLKNNLKNIIDKLKNDIADMIKKMKDVKMNLDIYYKIYEQICSSLENQEINYENILSLNEINNNNKINFYKIKDLSDFTIEEKFSKIINIYNLMKKKEKIMKATDNKPKALSKLQKPIAQKKLINNNFKFVNKYIKNQNNQINNIDNISIRDLCDNYIKTQNNQINNINDRNIRDSCDNYIKNQNNQISNKKERNSRCSCNFKTSKYKIEENNIFKYKNEINLIYNTPYTAYHNLFGKNFVEANINNIDLVINGTNHKLVEEYRLKKGKNTVR